MSKRKALRQHLRRHISPKLRRSLRIYIIVSFVVLIVLIVHAVQSSLNPVMILIGLVIGVIVGILFSRIYKISWDKDAKNIVYRMDVYGILLLIVFVAFDLNRGNLVGLFIHGDAVGTVSLALLSGAFYGRVLGAGRGIMKVLKEQEVFSLFREDKK